MCKGSGTSTSTSTTSANPAAMQAYYGLLGNAGQVAQTPYTPYGGQLVAPVNDQQYQGVSGINNYANFAQPYIDQATGMATAAAAPITSADINQYVSPYTQDVVNATQAQFNNQNQQQQSQVRGNAISQGAFGGDREAVAQAQTANQQQLAQAPVIAGLENQGYSTGLNTALTEQQAQAQGAYSLGNLGMTGQNAGLTGANAQIGAGTLEQGTQQAQDAAQYQQFMNQLAYPYQQLSWLAGIDTGVGSQMGGTSSGTSTPAPPSTFSQMMGLGALGSGLFGSSGAVSGLGSLGASALPYLAMLAKGGRVRANGGGVSNIEGSHTIPEPPETLRVQQKHLVAGHRAAQLFPHGTPELPVPPGMQRTPTHLGVFHHDPRRVSADHVRGMTAAGREHELLGLGHVSKAEVLARIHRGEIPLAVTERQPDGTEVRAAAGTHLTAHHQMAMMHRTKVPGNTIRVEHPAQVIHDRLARCNGGAVPGRDDGGGIGLGGPQAMPGLPTGPDLNLGSGSPYSGGQSWIPHNEIKHGAGPPKPPQMNQPAQPNLADQAKQIGQLAGLLKPGAAPTIGAPTSLAAPGVPQAAPTPVGGIMQPTGLDPVSSGEAIYRRGGAVRRYNGGVANFADGGGDDSFDDRFAAADLGNSPDFDATFNIPPGAVGDRNALLAAYREQNKGDPRIYADGSDSSPLPPKPVKQVPRGGNEEPFWQDAALHLGSTPKASHTALGYADDGNDGDPDTELPPAAEPASLRGGNSHLGIAPPVEGPEPEKKGGFDLSSNSKLWPALMTAGLGMLASRSPYAGVGIGEGGLAGMQAYSQAQQQENQNKIKQSEVQLRAQQLAKQLDMEERKFNQPKLTTDETGRPMLVNPQTGRVIPIQPGNGGTVPAGPAPDHAPPVGTTTAGGQTNTAAGEDTGTGEGATGASEFTPLTKEGVLPTEAPSKKAIDLPGTNPEVLEGMEPGDAAYVRSIAQGKEKFPSPTGKNAQHVNYIMNKVRLYDPAADGTDFARRQRTANFFAVGTQGGGGQQVTSFNRWAQHSSQLLDDYKKLDNGEWTFAQKGINALAANTPWDKTRRDLLRQIEVDRAAVAAEGAKVMAGSNTSLKDREHWLELFPSTMPFHEAKAAMSAQAHLVDGAIDALTGQYNQGYRTNHTAMDFMTPATRQRMPFLRGETDAPGAAPAQKPAAAAPAAPAANAAALSEARAAIAAGKPRDLIIQRLREHGIDPSGL